MQHILHRNKKKNYSLRHESKHYNDALFAQNDENSRNTCIYKSQCSYSNACKEYYMSMWHYVQSCSISHSKPRPRDKREWIDWFTFMQNYWKLELKLLCWFLYKAHSRSTNNWTTIQSIKTHCDFVLYNIPALIRWAVSRLLGVVSSLRLDQFHPDQYSIQSQGLDPGKSKTDWLSTHSHTPVGARAILTTESKEQIISHSAIGLIKRSVWLSVLNLLL